MCARSTTVVIIVALAALRCSANQYSGRGKLSSLKVMQQKNTWPMSPGPLKRTFIMGIVGMLPIRRKGLHADEAWVLMPLSLLVCSFLLFAASICRICKLGPAGTSFQITLGFM